MQKLQQNIVKKIYRLKHCLRLNFYFKPQTYKCTYEVTLNNNLNEIKHTTVIMPIPQNWVQQKISNVVFGEKGETVSEPEYNNQYFVASVSLLPKSKKKIIMEFTANISPIFFNKNLTADKKFNTIPVDNRFIATNDQIVQIVGKIIHDVAPQYEKVKSAYKYTVGRLKYGDQIDGLYSVKQALTCPRVDCGGYVTLLCSLLKTVEIPCIPVFGFFANHTIDNGIKNSMHAWGYIPLVKGNIFPVDPTEEYMFKNGQAYMSGGLGWVGSDRIIFSQGCDFGIKVKDKNIRVDILQNALIYPANSDLVVSTKFRTTIVR